MESDLSPNTQDQPTEWVETCGWCVCVMDEAIIAGSGTFAWERNLLERRHHQRGLSGAIDPKHPAEEGVGAEVGYEEKAR